MNLSRCLTQVTGVVVAAVNKHASYLCKTAAKIHCFRRLTQVTGVLVDSCASGKTGNAKTNVTAV